MKQKNQNTTSLRLLPNSPEAEKAVIGALLLDGSAIQEVNTILSVDSFHNPGYSLIYQAISDLYSRGNKIDMVSVMKELSASGKLEETGGAYALSELASPVVSSSHITDHAMYLHQLGLARRLFMSCQDISAKALNQGLDVYDTIGEAIRQMEAIQEGMNYNAVFHSIGNTSREAIALYERRKALYKEGRMSGISTGLKDLDYITNGGWKPGQLIILAARPAMGKTALALHFARSAALSGVPVMVFSLEMDVQGLTNRLILSEQDINQYRFSAGRLSEDEEMKLCNAANSLYGLPLAIDDTPGMSMQQIKSRARAQQIKGKCGLVLIDYLQLVDMRTQNKAYNREQEVSQASRSAKIMAKELGVPVILLSQLSRQVEGRAVKIPLLSDLRESGAIEQDADVVIFIHRPEYYQEESHVKGEGILRIAKQRDGATGDIAFKHNYNLTRITGNNETSPF
jgi:replicative DNA helicase